MVKCAAKYCDEETNNPSTFFRFPSSSFQTRRSLWVQKTGADILPTDNECYLCPKHFGPEQFRNRSLRWDAVPSLFPANLPPNTIIEEPLPLKETRTKKRKKKIKPVIVESEEELSNDSLSHLSNNAAVNISVEEPPPVVRKVVHSKKNLDVLRSPTPPPPPPVAQTPSPVLQPPHPDDDAFLDFEAEIDRLKDPLCKDRPVKKRKDEDVRTRFTEEDDIPLDRLFAGTRKVNAFNTDLPLPPRQPLPPTSNGNSAIHVEDDDDSPFIDNPDDPSFNQTDEKEPESILGDTVSYSGGDVPVAPVVETKPTEQILANKTQSTVSECFSLCSYCDFYASSEENLHEHEKKAHSAGENVTSKVYPFKILTKSDGTQFYLCDFCNFSGKTMALLVAHMVAHFPKENDKGVSIQKYCATIAVSGKNTKDVVTVSMNGADGNTDSDVVEICDDDDDDNVQVSSGNLDNIVIANVAGGTHEVTKLFPKSKRKVAEASTRVSPRKRK